MKRVLILMLFFASNAFAAHSVSGCNSTETSVINSNFTFGSNHFSDFEDFVEQQSDIKLKKCLRNRFKKNGKVVCEPKKTGSCKDHNGRSVNAWASYLSKKMHICPTFRNQISSLSTLEKKACLFALMVHEFGHTCFRGHGSVEPLDDLAFDFAANRFGVAINMAACGMD